MVKSEIYFTLLIQNPRNNHIVNAAMKKDNLVVFSFGRVRGDIRDICKMADESDVTRVVEGIDVTNVI